jgi:hypothetical protein
MSIDIAVLDRSIAAIAETSRRLRESKRVVGHLMTADVKTRVNEVLAANDAVQAEWEAVRSQLVTIAEKGTPND